MSDPATLRAWMTRLARPQVAHGRGVNHLDSPAVQLLVFTVVGMSAMLVAYAFGLGGAVSSLIFLAILFTGALIRVSRPILERLRP
jgi:uncharacterized membrane protein YjjP (DUF1212 family)